MHWLVLVATLVTVSSLKAHTQTSQEPAWPFTPDGRPFTDVPILMPFPGEPASKHMWPHSMMGNGKTNIVPPKNLSAHLAWTWHHETGKFGTILAGGPVIDSENNFYITGQDYVRKLNSDGKEQWKYRPPSPINNMPALGDNALFLVDKGGIAISLDLKTGQPHWLRQISDNAGGDSGYPACSNGLFIMASEVARSDGGNAKISALDQYTGAVMWEYRPAHPVWNFQPLFPGDETVVMMDLTGGMYKLGVHDGKQIWHAPAPESDNSFTDGGAVLGDNGMTYTCSNPHEAGGSEGTPGIVRAYDTLGRIVWMNQIPQPCNSYPAYGLLEGYSEPSVIVTPGSFMGTPTMHGGIVAFDARTGKTQWEYQAPVYTAPNNMAKGDWDGLGVRSKNPDPYVGSICLPAHWGAPTITGDGKIYVGRADGFLYSVRAYPPNHEVGDDPRVKDIDFPTTPGVEVDRFNAEGCSLHGSNAFAPGIMAFQTCDSLWVFKF